MKTKSLRPQIAAPVKREQFATTAALGQDASVDPSGFWDVIQKIGAALDPLHGFHFP